MYIGQKVECVNDTPRYGKGKILVDKTGRECEIVGDMDGLTKGAFYVIRDITENWIKGEMTPLIKVVGIVRPNGDHGFVAWRFRLVQDRKTETGVEMLKKLLNPINHRHLEGV